MSDDEIIPLTPVFDFADEWFFEGEPGVLILGEGDFWNAREDDRAREGNPSPDPPNIEEERRMINVWLALLGGLMDEID